MNTPEFASQKQVHEYIGGLLTRFGGTMYGLDEVAKLCLVALHTGGHVLLEGNPGFGKTDLVKTLGEVLGLPFGRIQFTPDLMPADITGTLVPDYRGGDLRRFTFQPGPLFTCLLLADEINRATPKTQAAMLEAMAERRVTVLGETHSLELPFMVLATQNPIDHEGTYTLPEAQLDRFMFKIHMPALGTETMERILGKTTGEMALPGIVGQAVASSGQVASLSPGADGAPRRRFREIVGRVLAHPASPLVQRHVLNLVFASNGERDKLVGGETRKLRQVCDLAEVTIRYGAGPRAVTALMRGAKAWSLLFSQAEAGAATGFDLARLFLPTIRHRLKLHFDWRENFLRWSKEVWRRPLPDELGAVPNRLQDLLLLTLGLLAAPEEDMYHLPFERLHQEALRAPPQWKHV